MNVYPPVTLPTRFCGLVLLELLAVAGLATTACGQGPAELVSSGAADAAANNAGKAKSLSHYRIADLDAKVLAAKPGRFFGPCALQKLKGGAWFLVYQESGNRFET
jgi:hypothetical protein